MLGSGRGYGGGGSEADSAVSLSSTAHKKTVHTRNVCIRKCVNAAVRTCVYMWRVCVVCVFPLQVVLSMCLRSWFCLLPVKVW